VIVTVTLVLAGLAASIIFYARVSGEAHDVFALDDDVVRGAAASACLAVSQALDQAGPDRVRRIAEGNVAIGGLVDAMEALGEPRLEEDRPAIDWIRDWEALAEARAEYSKVLVAGGDEPFLSPQTDDGYPITTRMVEVAPEQCERAVLLASQP